MIWLKSFARAIATAFEFGAMGGFLGAVISGVWGLVAGCVLIMPPLFVGSIDSGGAFYLLFFGLYLGALNGVFGTGSVLAVYGFLSGFRPQKPDFYRVFRSVIWGGWLCLLAGAVTALAVTGVCYLFNQNAFGVVISQNGGPLMALWMVFCFYIGSAAGAIVPSFVERYIQACDRIRTKRRARQSSLLDQER